MYETEEELAKPLVGKRIKQIFMGDQYLTFVTDDGEVSYEVEGDCCSSSYFHDFLGVKNILGKVVKKLEAVELTDKKYENREKEYGELTQFYGYRIIVEDEKLGEMTGVLAFRNESNGYYGGWMQIATVKPSKMRELTDDVLGD